MKTKSLYYLFLCIILIAGCSTVYGVKYDYSTDTDFSKYKTYDLMPVPKTANMNEFVVARVKKAIEAELSAKGLKRSSQNPDFLIAEHLAKQDKVEINSWGYGYGPYGGYWGGCWGLDQISTYHFEEGTLILDFIDAGSKKLIWRGTAKSDLQGVDSPEKSEALINKAVQKILQKYPPPSGS